MAAVNRFEDRAHVAAVIAGKGGALAAVDHGVNASQMPKGDAELITAWAVLEKLCEAADGAAGHVRYLLERAA